MVTLIRSVFSGAVVTGGGVSTLAFLDPVDDNEADLLLGYVRTFWDAIKDNLDEDVTITVQPNPARYAAATGELQQIFSTSAPTSVTGTATGNSAPRVAQALLRWRTSDIVNGRFVKGRTFIPGIGTALVTDAGGLSSVAITDITLAANALVQTSGSVVAVWHRPVNGAGGSEHIVTSVSVWDQFAVLRSRRD